jgi:DNA-binding GntR family transcriptional regulator
MPRPVPYTAASHNPHRDHAQMPTRTARRGASQARLQRENTHDEIYEKIYVAILEHRLHPGTKLVEERLAEIFGVSRARIREVLARLAHEQIVELYPQRGAYIARPTIEQAHDVFEARRLIEPAVLRRLIETLTPEKLTKLRQHQELERDARRREDKRAVIGCPASSIRWRQNWPATPRSRGACASCRY